MRYDNKRAEARTVATTEQSLQHAFDAKRAWSSVADRSDDEKVVQFALSAEAKLSFAIRSSLEGLAVSVERGEFDTVKDAARQHLADIVREGEVMSDDMTRAQFDAYEKNVASALANYGELIDQEEKEQFSLISERAQNIVDARRKVVELQEELEDLRSKTRPNSIVRDVASSIATFSPVARVLEVVEEAVKEGVAAVETNIKEGISAVEANVKQSLEPAPSASAEKGGVEEPKPSRSLPAEITSQYFLQHAADGAVRVFTNSKATREVFQDAGLVRLPQPFPHGLVLDLEIGRDIGERHQHESTFRHARMWHFDAFRNDSFIAIGQHIDIDGARTPAFRPHPLHAPFDVEA